MRREKREQGQRPAAELARVQRYHEGGSWGQGYAYMGFNALKYFKTDRTEPLTIEGDTLKRPSGAPLQGYGLEIETECSTITDEAALAQVFDRIIFPAFPADLFKMQRDGSLCGSSSAECITQVMTKDALRNMYPSFKAMYNHWFPAFGISCNSGNCGMHVNISLACFGSTSEGQAEAVRKLYYFVNRYFSLACSILCRDETNTGFCGRMPYTEARTLPLYNVPSNHGCAFNLGHYAAGRIELRIVGGQRNYAAFRNTMETVFHLVDMSKRVSWAALETGDLVQVFKGCNQYVFDRINTLGHLHFSTAQLAAIRETIKETELI